MLSLNLNAAREAYNSDYNVLDVPALGSVVIDLVRAPSLKVVFENVVQADAPYLYSPLDLSRDVTLSDYNFPNRIEFFKAVATDTPANSIVAFNRNLSPVPA